MSEIELKFGLTDAAAGAVESALRRHGASAAVLTSHYWDTAGRHLARAGLSLRLRSSGGRWEQTLKAAGPTPAERFEETVPRPGDWDDTGPAPELALHPADQPAARLLDRALRGPKASAAPALERAYTSVVDRLALTIELNGAEVEVAFDRGAIVAGERSLPVREVEIELKRGDAGALLALARANVDVHGMWLSTLTKSARGSRLARAVEPQAAKATAPRLERRANGAALFRAIVASCIEQVLANASLLAAGQCDDEVVHQLRVGIRRLRTAARELGAWRGALGAEWEAPMAEVFRALGAYRDRKTVAARVEQRLAAAGSPDPALQPGSPADDALAPTTLARGRSFQHALLDVLAFVMLPADADDASDAIGAADSAPDKTIGQRLDKLRARLQGDGRRFEELDPSARHAVRKRLKRLRYLAELVAPLYPRARVRRFLSALEPAQDELGNYMDLLVAARLAREAVEGGDARGWFNVGWLQAQVPRAVERSGRALRKAADARPFWG